MCSICQAFRPTDPACPYENTPQSAQARIRETSDAIASVATQYELEVGDSFLGYLTDARDRDWIEVNLETGRYYRFTLDSRGDEGMTDPYLRLLDQKGEVVATNDDVSGDTLNSALIFSVTEDATYYIEASSYYAHDGVEEENETALDRGNYTLSFELAPDPFATLPSFNYDQIAHQLTDVGQEFFGDGRQAFDVSTDRTLSVNLTAMNVGGQAFALAALEAWTNISGIRFITTTGAADITFDHNASDTAAFADTTVNNGIIQSATITITEDWFANDWNASTGVIQLDSYAFQTFIHEIGHALGLAHAGDYNGNAQFPTDATFRNDSWQLSVMSYFSQEENYTVDASLGFAVTPMIADIIAIHDLYGAPTDQRSGDTIYGEGSTAGGYLDQLSTVDQPIAMTIYDNGGIDTLNLSSANAHQRLDLRSEGFSDINGGIGNLIIARDTVIENARTGDGFDTIIGNDANNYFSSAKGHDLLIGLAGSDTLEGGAGNDTLFGEQFVASHAEDIAAQVYRLYRATLDRAPDYAGHSDWVYRLYTEDLNLTSAAAGFVNSREFQNTYGALDNGGFVEQLYLNVLDRASDSAGRSHWLNALSDGTSRADVVLGFSESREFVTATAQGVTEFTTTHIPSNWSDEVFRAYQATLDRNPDVAGFLSWIDRLSDGTSLITVLNGFVESQEFKNTYDTLDDGAFVDQLYLNVLDRAADEAGRQNWVTQLTDGTSRAEVALGFANSLEFIQNTTAALTTWVRSLGRDDVLIGGPGEDTLAGGTLFDTFVFSADQLGQQQVLDLEAWDQLAFRGFGYENAAEIRSHLSQSGSDVLFEDQGVRIQLVNQTLDQITDDMLVYDESELATFL